MKKLKQVYIHSSEIIKLLSKISKISNSSTILIYYDFDTSSIKVEMCGVDNFDNNRLIKIIDSAIKNLNEIKEIINKEKNF